MQSAAELKSLLNRIDHKGYPAYKDTKGIYQFQGYELSIDHVQGDPFASPSKVSVRVRGRQAAFPKELYKERHHRQICSRVSCKWKNDQCKRTGKDPV